MPSPDGEASWGNQWASPAQGGRSSRSSAASEHGGLGSVGADSMGSDMTVASFAASGSLPFDANPVRPTGSRLDTGFLGLFAPVGGKAGSRSRRSRPVESLVMAGREEMDEDEAEPVGLGAASALAGAKPTPGQASARRLHGGPSPLPPGRGGPVTMAELVSPAAAAVPRGPAAAGLAGRFGPTRGSDGIEAAWAEGMLGGHAGGRVRLPALGGEKQHRAGPAAARPDSRQPGAAARRRPASGLRRSPDSPWTPTSGGSRKLA